MKVYVFTAEQVFHGKVSDLIIRVYAKREDAVSMMDWFINDISKCVGNYGWLEDKVSDEFYMAYRNGDFANNHVEFNVREIEVEEYYVPTTEIQPKFKVFDILQRVEDKDKGMVRDLPYIVKVDMQRQEYICESTTEPICSIPRIPFAYQDNYIKVNEIIPQF